MARRKAKTQTVNGTLYYYETVEFPRKADGKRDIRYARGKTVKEMEEKLNKLLEMKKHGVTSTNTIYFTPMYKEWFYNTHIKGKKVSTINRYEGLLNKYIKDSSLSRVKISSLNAMHIQRYYNQLENSNTSASTISMIHKILRPFLNYLYNNGLTIKDFGTTGLIKLPKVSHKEKDLTVLTLEEQEKFIESIKDNRDRLLFLFALTTGLREGELLSLTWKDIKNGNVNVNKSVRYDKIDGKLQYIVTTPKTKYGMRNVPLHPDISSELKIHKLNQNNIKSKAGELYNDKDLVFCTDLGSYINGTNINKRFKKALINANIRPMKFHSLRHTYATRLFENNERIERVSKWMGHSSVAITQEIYTWVIESLDNSNAETIKNAFSISI